MTNMSNPVETAQARNFLGARIADARAAPIENGRASALMMAIGDLELRWYAPSGEDAQTPHDQDELYFVAFGSGWFVRGSSLVRFQEGDVIFVPAGQPHRFEEFEQGFGVWVVFFGPKHDALSVRDCYPDEGQTNA
jgi:mannose-6-phosphate isomerase-like protein (cupin superfamily)